MALSLANHPMWSKGCFLPYLVVCAGTMKVTWYLVKQEGTLKLTNERSEGASIHPSTGFFQKL